MSKIHAEKKKLTKPKTPEISVFVFIQYSIMYWSSQFVPTEMRVLLNATIHEMCETTPARQFKSKIPNP